MRAQTSDDVAHHRLEFRVSRQAEAELQPGWMGPQNGSTATLTSVSSGSAPDVD
ncbi:hypothetical protein [Leifsonia poae]|uniref:hypothetical protein n=1 Tax=Leifsonia poae TaxID=110933 RepID=UPI0022F26AE7|nr:hypothetical protein [Leifsonia poae]